MENKKGFFNIVNKWIFFPSGIALVIFVALGVINPESFGAAANVALNFVFEHFTWFIIPVTFAMVILCFWVCFSKYGKIKLGGPDAKPKISKPVWFAIALTSGIGAGINYYGVYEPVFLAYNPPEFLGVDPLSSGAILASMKYTFLHWCVHPYALYTAAGLAVVFLIYNAKKRYRVSTAFYPIIGEKVYGGFGNFIDCVAVFAIVGGIAASLGFATLQISRGLDKIFGFESNAVNWLVIIGVLALVYLLSSISGLHKGITYISNINTGLYIFVLVFSFVVIDPAGVVELTFSSIGQYINNFIDLSLFMDPVGQSGWTGSWTVFMFSMWTVYSPLIGLFLVKLAYGRTLREFVTVNLIAPVIFSFAWFGVFGGGAMLLEKFAGTNIYELIQSVGSDMSLYAFFDQLPLGSIMNVVALIIVILSFITLAESLTMSIAQMTCKNVDDETGEATPPRIVTIFWGIIMALAAWVLLISGGIDALQTSVVVCALPIGIFMCFMACSFIKSMKNLKDYDIYSKGDLSVYNKKKKEED